MAPLLSAVIIYYFDFPASTLSFAPLPPSSAHAAPPPRSHSPSHTGQIPGVRATQGRSSLHPRNRPFPGSPAQGIPALRSPLRTRTIRPSLTPALLSAPHLWHGLHSSSPPHSAPRVDSRDMGQRSTATPARKPRKSLSQLATAAPQCCVLSLRRARIHRSPLTGGTLLPRRPSSSEPRAQFRPNIPHAAAPLVPCYPSAGAQTLLFRATPSQ